MKKLSKIFLVIFVALILIVLYEFIQGIRRQRRRVTIYKMAQKRANELNTKLIVVGDPYYGKGSQFFNQWMEVYGCGDETVDLTGAPQCPRGVKTNLLSYLKSKPDNYGVIFISCVLEYIPTEEFDETVKELVRVSGGFKNIFIVTVDEMTFAAYFYKDKHSSSKQIVYGPPAQPFITYKKI